MRSGRARHAALESAAGSPLPPVSSVVGSAGPRTRDGPTAATCRPSRRKTFVATACPPRRWSPAFPQPQRAGSPCTRRRPSRRASRRRRWRTNCRYRVAASMAATNEALPCAVDRRQTRVHTDGSVVHPQPFERVQVGGLQRGVERSFAATTEVVGVHSTPGACVRCDGVPLGGNPDGVERPRLVHSDTPHAASAISTDRAAVAASRPSGGRSSPVVGSASRRPRNALRDAATRTGWPCSTMCSSRVSNVQLCSAVLAKPSQGRSRSALRECRRTRLARSAAEAP